MKRNSIVLIVLFLVLTGVSCNDPETIITNIIHSDGSITRKIEMKSMEKDPNKRFKISEIQVPVDSSWNTRDSIELNEKGDTIWFRLGEKLFRSAEEINQAYKSDSGSNHKSIRSAHFKRSFRWFNTVYHFSESIEKKLSFGYPVEGFLNKEELRYFYTPDDEKENNLKSADSLKFKSLEDSLKQKTDKWFAKNLVSEWIGDFSKLIEGKAVKEVSFESLKSQEDKFTQIFEKADNQLDSLWKNGSLLKELIGETNAVRYKTEADSALTLVTNNLFENFSNYSVRIIMPGKLIGSNGFIDSNKMLLWPVKSDYFVSERYDMWAESKTTNKWAWIVSGIFLAFVLAGIIFRTIKKD